MHRAANKSVQFSFCLFLEIWGWGGVQFKISPSHSGWDVSVWWTGQGRVWLQVVGFPQLFLAEDSLFLSVVSAANVSSHLVIFVCVINSLKSPQFDAEVFLFHIRLLKWEINIKSQCGAWTYGQVFVTSRLVWKSAVVRSAVHTGVMWCVKPPAHKQWGWTLR